HTPATGVPVREPVAARDGSEEGVPVGEVGEEGEEEAALRVAGAGAQAEDISGAGCLAERRLDRVGSGGAVCGAAGREELRHVGRGRAGPGGAEEVVEAGVEVGSGDDVGGGRGPVGAPGAAEEVERLLAADGGRVGAVADEGDVRAEVVVLG